MKSSDRTILLVLPLLAVIAGLWLLVISPKRSEAGKLEDQAAALQAEATQADQEASQAEAARGEFDKNYSALVKLGAAAPADGDQASMVYDLAAKATANNVRFSGFELNQPEESAVATPEPATTTESASASSESSSGTSTDASASTATTSTDSAASTTTAAPATEATAATLPIGASIGPAGLPVSSYNFNLDGRFFDTTNFLDDVENNVRASETGPPRVHGRLLTIDGFSYQLDQLTDFPRIQASFRVTAYQVPKDQGVSAGATPAGPAPAGTTEASTTATTTTPAPAATVTP
jgi:hypothetical protein